MRKWPYALPNLVSAVFLLSSAFIVILGLEEVYMVLIYKFEHLLIIDRPITCFKINQTGDYASDASSSAQSFDVLVPISTPLLERNTVHKMISNYLLQNMQRRINRALDSASYPSGASSPATSLLHSSPVAYWPCTLVLSQISGTCSSLQIASLTRTDRRSCASLAAWLCHLQRSVYC